MICPTNHAAANFCQARSNPEPPAQRGSRSYLQLVSNIVLLLLTIFFYVPILATHPALPLRWKGSTMWAIPTVRSDGFVGGLRRGLTENLGA